MFNFRGFTCKFHTEMDMYNNTSISVYTVDGLFLYQLTETFPFPIADGVVVLKDAPFIVQFLAQMQKEGLLIGKLGRHTIDGRSCLCGKILRKCAAAAM